MESKRLELETALNAATIRAYELARADITRATPLDVLAADTPPAPGLALKIYRLGTAALRPAVPLLLNMRGRQGKEDLSRRGERLGFAGLPRPEGQLVWVHAASVGETNAILPLIDNILDANPNVHILLTTGTKTSAEVAARRLPPRAVHQYVPLDVPQYVARFLDHWKPSLAIFTESDIWPNLILGTSERRIPLVLVNARMSPRSIRRWRKYAGVGRPLFSRFAAVLAQNSADRPGDEMAWRAERHHRWQSQDRFTAAAGQCGNPGDAEKCGRRTAAVPRRKHASGRRHPHSGGAFADTPRGRRAADDHRTTASRTRQRTGGDAWGARPQNAIRTRSSMPDTDTEIYIADTIGELGTFYSISPVSLVGGSLVEHGGQNPIEAVRLGSCVLTGPFVHNFRDAYAALFREGGAVEVRSSDDIARQVTLLLKDQQAAERMRHGADVALQSLGGSLAKTLGAIQPLLEKQRA